MRVLVEIGILLGVLCLLTCIAAGTGKSRRWVITNILFVLICAAVYALARLYY